MKLFQFDIENKILVPFVLLLIISVVTLGGVSYWTSYQMLLNNEISNLSRHLERTTIYLDEQNQQVAEGHIDMETARLRGVNHFKRIDGKRGFILTGGNTLLMNAYETDQRWIRPFSEAVEDSPQGNLQLGEDVFVYRHYQPWGWVVGLGMKRQVFFQEVLDSQKYMILLAIVSLVFSMQAAIIIAYHLSKPVKELVDVFGRVGQGHISEKVSFVRNDEIGQLANAFNDMIDRLNQSTEKVLEMTRLKEDILRNINTGIVTTDSRGKLLSTNPAARNILHQVNQGKEDPLELEAIAQQIRHTLETGTSHNAIHTFQSTYQQEMSYLDVMTSLLRSESGDINGVICSFRDITERKRIENNMEVLDRLTSMGELAAGMAHEVRNPLAGMKTSLQVLQRRMSHDNNESNQKLFHNTLYEIDRINSLITELLNFARPRKPEYEAVAIEDVLNRSLDLTRTPIEEKNIKIQIVDEAPHSFIWVDRRQLEQIFLNLIKNAVNAMDMKGTMDIFISQDSQDVPGQESLEIEFRDNGCGIPSTDLEKIFNPFFTTNPQGIGLGLSVVYELVKENRGTITVASQPGEGSRFRLSFPLFQREGGTNHDNESLSHR